MHRQGIPDAASVGGAGDPRCNAMLTTNPIANSSRAALERQARLLNMRQAAAYLGCSFWTARDYVLQGLIPAVDMPPLAPPAGRPSAEDVAARAHRPRRPRRLCRIAKAPRARV